MANHSPTFPLEFDSKYGYREIDSTKNLVKFHLTNVLLTSPGERISDPAYGAGVRRYLFEQITPDQIIRMESKIKSAIARDLSYLRSVMIRVVSPLQDSTLNPNTVVLSIKYTISNINVTDVLNLTIAATSDSSAQSYS